MMSKKQHSCFVASNHQLSTMHCRMLSPHPSPSAEPHALFQGSIIIAQEDAMDHDQADTVSKIKSFCDNF